MYQFYLDDVMLPVAPGKLTIKIKNQNKTLNLINEGEVNLLKTPGLTEVKFKALLPNAPYPFAEYPDGYHPAVYYLSLFEKLKTERCTAQFVVLRTLDNGETLEWETNMKVSLEGYEIEENADNGNDMYVDVTLKQYRDYGTKVITIQTNQTKPTTLATESNERSIDSKPKGAGYTIQSGDTLWSIARRELGDGSKWKTIYEANKKIIDDAAKGRGMPGGGDWIFSGTIIQIPR